MTGSAPSRLSSVGPDRDNPDRHGAQAAAESPGLEAAAATNYREEPMSTVEVAAQSNEVALARIPGLIESLAVGLTLPPDAIQLNGLRLVDSDMKFEEWVELGHRIGFVGRWRQFAIGDWVLFGEAVYGEDSSQAFESTTFDRYNVANRVTGLATETIRNYVRVAQGVPLPIRRVELDWGMHEAVYALEREDQIFWLGQAVENSFDRSELRQAIKDAKNPPQDGDQDVLPPADPPMSRTELLMEAASRVFHQAQPTSDGGVLVPAEPWAAFVAALGEE